MNNFNNYPLSSNKLIFILGKLYLICFLPFYFWCINRVANYISGWGFIFTFGAPFFILAIPEIIMSKALKKMNSQLVIDSIIINTLFGLIFNNLSSVPCSYGDEGGGSILYHFNLRFWGLTGLISCIVIGIFLALLLSNLSAKSRKIISRISIISGGILILCLGGITHVQKQHQISKVRTEYARKIKSQENSELSTLTHYVRGVKKVKFAIVPPNKLLLSEAHSSSLWDQTPAPIIEINGKKISNDDFDYLTNQYENESFDKQQKLAIKYGLTMKKSPQTVQHSFKQIKKIEIYWSKEQMDKQY